MDECKPLVVGNGDGVVGFSTGKGKEVGKAVEMAYKKASRSLIFVERFEAGTHAALPLISLS